MGVDWVRFAEIGIGGTLGVWELGSFRIFGSWAGRGLGSFCAFACGRVEIGFVSRFLVLGRSPAERPGLNTGGPPAAGVLSDGVSFRIIGENPGVRIQNSGE